MRLTKGMKKALSMFLTGALVVTGASIPASKTEAATADTFYWEGVISANDKNDSSTWKTEMSNTNMDNNDLVDYSTWSGGTEKAWCGANLTGTFDLTGFDKPAVKVTYNNTGKAAISEGVHFAFETDAQGSWKNDTWAEAATGTALTVTQDVALGEEKDAQYIAVAPKDNSPVTITKIEIYDAAYGQETPEGTSFTATLQYLNPSWSTNEASVKVTEDGEYTLTTWATEDAATSINMAWIETDLKNGSVSEDFKMNVKSIQLGTKLFTYSKTDDRYLSFKDQKAVVTQDKLDDNGDAVLDGSGNPVQEEVAGTYRLNIKNIYNALYDFNDHQTKVKGTKADMFMGKDLVTDDDVDNGICGVNKGDVVQVKFTVEGLASEKAAKKYEQIADKDAEVEDTVNAGEYGNVEYTVSTVENIANPDASVAPSQTPAATDNGNTNPTQSPATTDKGNTTASQSPAPTLTPSQTPAASVQPSQKPVVKKTTKNACTKVKAKKAKVTVKKGKKATLKFAVTAKNKKAKTTDKMTVSVKNKKIVTVSKKSLAKGSATVTVKGKKKGSTKVTVKIGKKSAKVTVKVK